MLRFTLFGFPVTIQWMFWVVGLLLGSSTLSIGGPLGIQLTLAWMVVFFVSILWHELGHAFAFRNYGQRPEIVLHGMGGYAQGSGRLTRKQDIIVSLAGPVAGFLLGLAVWLAVLGWPAIVADKPVMSHFVINMLWINIIWSAVNLLPVLPLDGGRVCSAALSGTRHAALVPKIGVAAAAIMVVAALSFRMYIAAALFGYLGYQNWLAMQGQGNPRGGGMFGSGRP